MRSSRTTYAISQSTNYGYCHLKDAFLYCACSCQSITHGQSFTGCDLPTPLSTEYGYIRYGQSSKGCSLLAPLVQLSVRDAVFSLPSTVIRYGQPSKGCALLASFMQLLVRDVVFSRMVNVQDLRFSYICFATLSCLIIKFFNIFYIIFLLYYILFYYKLVKFVQILVLYQLKKSVTISAN